MASVAYGPTLARCFTDAGDNLGSGGSTLKMMLLNALSNTPDNPDHAFVNALTAGTNDEFDDTGYTGGFGGAGRKTIASQAFTYDATDNRCEFTFSNITWTALGGAQTVVGSVLIREITDDTASPVFFFWDTADVVTNAQDFTLTVGAQGAVHVA